MEYTAQGDPHALLQMSELVSSTVACRAPLATIIKFLPLHHCFVQELSSFGKFQTDLALISMGDALVMLQAGIQENPDLAFTSH